MEDGEQSHPTKVPFQLDRGWKLLAYGKRHHVCFLYKDVERDRNWVKVTSNILETAGFICWYKDRDCIAGQTYAATITKTLEDAAKIVLVLSVAFLDSPRCKYDLDLAIEESLSRGEDGETGVLIPIILETCSIPKILRPLHTLDIEAHKDDWLSILVRAIEKDDKFSSLPDNSREKCRHDIDESATTLCKKLQTASVHEVFDFLSKPVAQELSHFLSQCSDLRFFVSAMNTCGVEILESKVSFKLKTFSEFTDTKYQLSHCFKEYAFKLSKTIKEVDLVIEKPNDVLKRENREEVKEFNQLVSTILKPPNNTLWGIMWHMKGIQSKMVRDECRSLIHDALIDNIKMSAVSHPHFISLNKRIDSFKNWPQERKPTKDKLAEAGYFLDTEKNILRCFYCDGVSWDLKPDEDPWERHAKWYFNCPYVLSSKTEDFINRCRFHKIKRNDIYNTLYKSLDSRLQSYKNWPCGDCANPECMSKAGFYFTNIEDKVVCFHCGYGVRNWQKDDNPWYRHAWWSPHCSYLRQHKGASFIEYVLNDRAKLEPIDTCTLTYSLNVRETR